MGVLIASDALVEHLYTGPKFLAYSIPSIMCGVIHDRQAIPLIGYPHAPLYTPQATSRIVPKTPNPPQ